MIDRFAFAALIAFLPAGLVAQEESESPDNAPDAVATDEGANEAPQSTPSQGTPTGQIAAQNFATATEIMGAEIVSVQGDYDEDLWAGNALNAVIADFTPVGRVEEMLLDEGGQLLGVTTDVGGFLGIGQKTVLIPLEDLRLARTGDDAERIILITRLAEDALQEASPFE